MPRREPLARGRGAPGRGYVRAWMVGCLVLVLTFLPGPHRATALGATSAAAPALVLTAENHPGLHSILANLNEEVTFIAHWTGPMQKGEYIAIVTGKTLVTRKPCASSPCSGAAHQTEPGAHRYVAELYGGQRVIKSAPVTVDWEKLTLDVQVTSVVQGTLHDDGGNPQTFDQLNGLPIHLSVAAPHGWATSWKTIEIRELQDDGTWKAILKFTPAGNPWVESAVRLNPSQYEAVAKDATGLVGGFAPVVIVKPRTWNLVFQVADALSSSRPASTDSFSVDVGKAVILTAVIQEPEGQALAKFVRLDLQRDPTDPKKYFSEKQCENAWTCSVTVSKSTAQTVEYQAFVEIVYEPTQEYQKIGSSTFLHVTWALATLTVKPTLSFRDRVPLDPSFPSQGGTVDVSGTITDTYAGSDGKQTTTCVDALYFEVDIPGAFSCDGTWPDPTSSGPYREASENVQSPNIALPESSCTAWPCGLYNALDYTGVHAYSQQHTYTLDITNVESGGLAFWAFPLGQPGQGQTYKGQFDLTLHP